MAAMRRVPSGTVKQLLSDHFREVTDRNAESTRALTRHMHGSADLRLPPRHRHSGDPTTNKMALLRAPRSATCLLSTKRRGRRESNASTSVIRRRLLRRSGSHHPCSTINPPAHTMAGSRFLFARRPQLARLGGAGARAKSKAAGEPRSRSSKTTAAYMADLAGTPAAALCVPAIVAQLEHLLASNRKMCLYIA